MSLFNKILGKKEQGTKTNEEIKVGSKIQYKNKKGELK